MLLSSLSILMGAILVPIDYLWMYSTHIILVCLYLIHTKRLIVMCLTFISIMSVYFNEFSHNVSTPFEQFVEQAVLVDFERKQVIVNLPHTLNLNGNKKVYDVNVVYFLEDGTRRNLENFTLVLSDVVINRPSDFSKSNLTEAVIKNIALPDKNGSWWQRNLYIERVSAQFELSFVKANSDYLSFNIVTVRQHFLDQLDYVFSHFSSWRYSKALLLGENNLWSQRDTWIVRTLGLAHLFVVSGLHTGFMFAIGRLLSRSLWQFSPSNMLLSGVTRWHCDVLIILPLLLGYAYLTNWGEPVIRASIMLSTYLCARMLVLKVSPYGIVTFALWLVLLIEPRSILSPGLWLSFTMVYLLIGFCQISTKLPRLILLQVMLSTASMVLILGWQEGISSVSIIMNILLIPLAGFIWFPWGIMSCLEALIFKSTYSYSLLDQALVYLELFLEWMAFSTPIFYFEKFSSAIPRIIMLFLIGYWVYQSPLKRGLMSVFAIWFIVFPPVFVAVNKADFRLLNKENTLVLKDASSLVLSSAWSGDDINKLMFGDYVALGSKQGYLLSPHSIQALTPQLLLKYKIDWVILRGTAPIEVIEMFEALDVDWLVISSDDFLDFHFQNDRVRLRHSDCIYSFFLLKSDTCKRVEKLESVLNYIQT